MHVDVHFLPGPRTAADVAGRTVVVIDILRATTTILQSLWSGESQVIPCLEVDKARHCAETLGNAAVLGGERGGKPIPGFDVGNSPAEYTAARVAGKTVVITTTNGTRALRLCTAASRVLVGAFTNISSLITELKRAERLSLLCAGTDDHVTSEDVLFAGAVVTTLQAETEALVANDEAEIAGAAWRATVGELTEEKRLRAAITASRGGSNLVALGFSQDIFLAARVNTCPIVAELLVDDWRIVSYRPT